jgi:hypothetical protein
VAEVRRDVVIGGILAAVESAHFYSAFLPSIMTIRKFGRDAEALQALRQGQVIATVATVLLGAVVAAYVQHSAPLVIAVVFAVLMVAVYEAAIKGTIQTVAGGSR